MKLERLPGRIRKGHAAEALGQEKEQSDMLFDPRVDFDPEVKRSMLEDLSRLGSVGRANEERMEYFYAIFPDEFESLHTDQVSKDSIINALKKSEDARFTGNIFRGRQQLAEKFLLLHPGERTSLPLLGKDKENITSLMALGPIGDPLYVHHLFLSQLLFSTSQEAQGQIQDWDKVLEGLSVAREDGHPINWYAKQLAYLRLAFPERPERDITSLLTPEDLHKIKKELKRLSHNPVVNETTELDQRPEYAELAWALTIISAERVGITFDGQIEFELPKRSLRANSKLPERLVA